MLALNSAIPIGNLRKDSTDKFVASAIDALQKCKELFGPGVPGKHSALFAGASFGVVAERALAALKNYDSFVGGSSNFAKQFSEATKKLKDFPDADAAKLLDEITKDFQSLPASALAKVKRLCAADTREFAPTVTKLIARMEKIEAAMQQNSLATSAEVFLLGVQFGEGLQAVIMHSDFVKANFSTRVDLKLLTKILKSFANNFDPGAFKKELQNLREILMPLSQKPDGTQIFARPDCPPLAKASFCLNPIDYITDFFGRLGGLPPIATLRESRKK